VSALPKRAAKLFQDSQFDGASGIHNMPDIIAKVNRLAHDNNVNDKRKKPYFTYKEFRCPFTGQLILSLPVGSVSGLRAFRKLNSLSRNLTLQGLKSRLYTAQSFDGFSIFDKEGLLFEEDIGFPDDEAMKHGLQIASEFIASVTLSHPSQLRELHVGMDVSERGALVSAQWDHALLKSLTQGNCDFMNPTIRAILGCEADDVRTSLTGSGVLPAENETQSSVEMNVVARAIVQTRCFNLHRVEASSDCRGWRRKGRVGVHRVGGSTGRHLALIRYNPKKEKHEAVSAADRKLVMEELKLVNFMVNRSITFRSIDEQRDYYIDLCEYVMINVWNFELP
jgi:hypothetical protein